MTKGSQQLVNEVIDALRDYIEAVVDYDHRCRRGDEWRTTDEIVRTGTVLEQAIHKLIGTEL